MRLHDSKLFLCRTNGGGPTLALDSPELLGAVRALKPVVILDTAIRFSSAENENDAAQNRLLANQMYGLISAGAPGVIAIHHSTKSSGRDTDVKLENTLRGTGDFGAMADAVYSFRCEDSRKLLVVVHCVKAREFEERPPFHIQGRPYISDTGDFAMIEELDEEEKLERALTIDPRASLRQLEKETGIGKNRLTTVAEGIGWRHDGRVWVPEKTVLH